MELDPQCQDTFETLCQRITSEPVLIQPNLTKPFKLEVDASGFALGAVLTQRGDDGKKHPIAFYSTTLTEAERNYDIWDLELLAVIKGTKELVILSGRITTQGHCIHRPC
jgi:hypothetical protein